MAILGFRELDDLAMQIEKRAGTDELITLLSRANQRGELEAFLASLGFEDLLFGEDLYEFDLKILVIGDSMVKASKIESIARQEGIDSDRLEFCLGYDKAKRFPFHKVTPARYRAVIFGPVSHSTNGKGDASSVIANFERRQDEGVLVVRATEGNGTLKLTNNSVRRAFKELNERCNAA